MSQGQGIGGIAPRAPVKIDAPTSPVAVKPAKAEAPQPMDGFATLPSAGTTLHGEQPPGSIPVAKLVPDLSKLNQLAQIRARFASDQALLGNLLHPPDLPANNQLERTLAFFMAYAERFVKVAKLQPDAGTQNQEDPQAQSGKKGKDPGGQLPNPGGDVPEPGFPVPDPVLVVLGEVPTAEPLPEPLPEGHLPVMTEPGAEPEAPAEHAGPIAFVETPEEPPPLPFRSYTAAEHAQEVSAFVEVVDQLGFGKLKDAVTGRSGVEVAEQLLDSSSLAELHSRLDEVQWALADLPAPDPHATITQDIPVVQEQASPAGAKTLTRADGTSGRPTQAAPAQVQGQAVAQSAGAAQPWGMAAVPLARSGRDEAPEPSPLTIGGTSKRLGRKMLWNVLHAFRGRGDELVTEKDKMDRLTYGAIFVLAGLALAIAVLASL